MKILKRSSTFLTHYSMKEIREKIAMGKLKEAINILRGLFPDDDRAILRQTQISQTQIDDIGGLIMREEKNVAFRRIEKKVLDLVGLLAEEKD